MQIYVRLLRDTIVKGKEGKTGEVFPVSRMEAALLTGDGAAEFVDEHAKPTTVTTIQADNDDPEVRHGDPALPKKVTSGPVKVK